MEAYTSFAQVYDLFMDNVPYETWCDFIDETLKKYGIEEKILLDLGCGTGKMTRIMAQKGYDMIGIDNSPEMLDIAREQEGYCAQEIDWNPEEETEHEEEPECEENPEDGGSTELQNREEEEAWEKPEEETARIENYLQEHGMEEEYYDHAYEGKQSQTLYLCQDMRNLELYGTIGACYCACDSLNYILEEEDVKTVFGLVNNYLYPKGLFIFDINTPYKYEVLLADRTIAETRPEGSFIWDNYYDKETRINEYDLTLFIREDLLLEEGQEADFLPEEAPYYRFQETHYQKCYTLETIRRLLEEAGMEYIGAFDCYSKEPVRSNSEKITVIAREKGKNRE